MTDQKTTEALRTSMRQVVDMAPPAPDLPATTLPRGRTVHPTIVIAAAFAVVFFSLGIGALLLGSRTDTSSDVGEDGKVNVPVASTTVATTPAPVENDSRAEADEPQVNPYKTADGNYTLQFQLGENSFETVVKSPVGPPTQAIVAIDGVQQTVDIDWTDPEVGKASIESGEELVLIDVLP